MHKYPTVDKDFFSPPIPRVQGFAFIYVVCNDCWVVFMHWLAVCAVWQQCLDLNQDLIVLNRMFDFTRQVSFSECSLNFLVCLYCLETISRNAFRKSVISLQSDLIITVICLIVIYESATPQILSSVVSSNIKSLPSESKTYHIIWNYLFISSQIELLLLTGLYLIHQKTHVSFSYHILWWIL